MEGGGVEVFKSYVNLKLAKEGTQKSRSTQWLLRSFNQLIFKAILKKAQSTAKQGCFSFANKPMKISMEVNKKFLSINQRQEKKKLI